MKDDFRYLIVTEAALDIILTHRLLDDTGIPKEKSRSGLIAKTLDEETLAYACGTEQETDFFALVTIDELRKLGGPKDIVYARIARVLKSARKPPIHLPRSWAEFHHGSLISFFAESQKQDSRRWIAKIDGEKKFVFFPKLTDSRNTVNLESYQSPKVSPPFSQLAALIETASNERLQNGNEKQTFVKEFDLSAIGGSAVVAGHSFDDWLPKLSDAQRRAVKLPPTESLRVVGPAGTGKTLTLCMRAIYLSKHESIIGGRKRILVVAHSWAMAERIDQILTTLNLGQIPDRIVVLPLLSVIQLHSNSSMGAHHELLGDDSQDGSRRVIEIIERILSEDNFTLGPVSKWIREAYFSGVGSNAHGELVFDLYEEITGVIAAQNIFPGDNDKIADYYSMQREDYLPPFESRDDRMFCMTVFESLLSRLIDRGLITTDQFILDSIRVFETFSWNVRRQTEGYDYILVDELQLFGPQERLAISLLASTRTGFAWAAAEDPSQGVFSSLYGREGKAPPLDDIYLHDVHRFNYGLFRFIEFVYGKFPLNVPPLNIDHAGTGRSKPVLSAKIEETRLVPQVVSCASQIVSSLKQNERLAVVLIGDGADDIVEALNHEQLNPVRLSSFDDVERLAYQKKAIVVSPWQFIGGTQFSHVLLVVTESATPQSSFSRLRELTAIYLGASRASDHLQVFCGSRIPQILQEAIEADVISEMN